MRSIVLLTVEPGAEKRIAMALKEMDEVVEAHITKGLYDLLVIIEAITHDAPNVVVAEKIRKIKGVRSTLTLRTVKLSGAD